MKTALNIADGNNTHGFLNKMLRLENFKHALHILLKRTHGKNRNVGFYQNTQYNEKGWSGSIRMKRFRVYDNISIRLWSTWTVPYVFHTVMTDDS